MLINENLERKHFSFLFPFLVVTVNQRFNRPFYILLKKEGAFLITDAPVANWQGKGECMRYINVFQRTANIKKGKGEREKEREGGRGGGIKKKKKKGT